MAKTKISEFSTTAGNNTDINSINIAEGCAPSGINDAIRELMRQLKEFQTGGAGDSVNSGGDFSVATNKFTVASATGNTSVAGTLGATGNFAINTDKFTATASSGNTSVAGTLASTGNFAVNTDKFTVAASTGNTAVGGTFAVTGATTLTGALVANGNSTIGDADTDTVTLNASFVNGTTLKTAKTATNTLALAAYDVDGTAYTNLVTLTAGNTPSLALTSTAVGTINNMSIGATTASTGAFTTLSASSDVTLSGGTANGVAYLNGSKVVTTGSALTFDGTNLSLGGGTAFSSAGYQSLNLNGSTSGFLNIKSNGTDNFWLFSDGSNQYVDARVGGLIFRTDGGNERMRLTSTGLGIGTSSPAQKLHLSVASAAAIAFRIQNSAGNTYLSTQADGHTELSAADASGYITFMAGGGTERARIDSSGNLLVGTMSTIPAGSGTNDGFCVYQGGVVGISAENDRSLFLKRRSSDGNLAVFYRDNTAVGSISVTSSATAYNTSSDYRLKNTIAPMTGALAKVALLKPCTYKWNADGSDGEGFIAHELAEVVPQCVTGEKDAVDAEGKPQYQGIDTSFLVATLTAAIQEQQAIINAQQSALQTLTARVAALESN